MKRHDNVQFYTKQEPYYKNAIKYLSPQRYEEQSSDKLH